MLWGGKKNFSIWNPVDFGSRQGIKTPNFSIIKKNIGNPKTMWWKSIWEMEPLWQNSKISNRIPESLFRIIHSKRGRKPLEYKHYSWTYPCFVYKRGELGPYSTYLWSINFFSNLVPWVRQSPLPTKFFYLILLLLLGPHQSYLKRMLWYVHHSLRLGGNMNSSFLDLIPKESNPISFSRFQPISLCNSSYNL